MFVEGGVDLAGAEDDAVDFIVGFDGIISMGGVGDNPFEVGVAGKIFNGGAGKGVSQEEFGEEEDESWERMR